MQQTKTTSVQEKTTVIPTQQVNTVHQPHGHLPPQGHAIHQQGQFVAQQPPVVAHVPEVPVKGVGLLDKMYMGAHNLKEHIKDKLYAHKETTEVKKIVKAEMKAERQGLEAQQLPVKAQIEAEKKVICQEKDMAVDGLKTQLEAERIEFERRQAAVQAQLEAEKKAFLAQQEMKLAGLKNQFTEQKAFVEEKQVVVQSQLEAERLALKQQQEEAMHGIKANLADQKKAIEHQGLEHRAVVNQQFADRVIYEHTLDAQAKQQKLGLEAERKAFEANVEQQIDMQKAAAKEQAHFGKQAIKEQAFHQSQAAVAQHQAAYVQQPQQFIHQGPAMRQDIPANMGVFSQGQGYVHQGEQYQQQTTPQFPQQSGHHAGQYGNSIEHRVDHDVNKIHGGQEFIQRERDIVRDASGRVIADAKNIERNAVKETRHGTEIKHEEKTKVNERI